MVGGGVREWQATAHGYRISLREDKNIPKWDSGDDCITSWLYKEQWAVYLKQMNFTVCELHLNKCVF